MSYLKPTEKSPMVSLSLSLKSSCSTATLPCKQNTDQSASNSVHINGGCCNFQFVVDQVAPGQVFLQALQFYAVPIIQPMLFTHSLI
jgi:hypothetical protein